MYILMLHLNLRVLINRKTSFFLKLISLISFKAHTYLIIAFLSFVSVWLCELKIQSNTKRIAIMRNSYCFAWMQSEFMKEKWKEIAQIWRCFMFSIMQCIISEFCFFCLKGRKCIIISIVLFQLNAHTMPTFIHLLTL